MRAVASAEQLEASQPSESVSTTRALSLAVGTYTLPHPDKVETRLSLAVLRALQWAGKSLRKPQGNTLSMMSMYCQASYGGEDALFVSSSAAAIGVADGVGGWSEDGINPAGQWLARSPACMVQSTSMLFIAQILPSDRCISKLIFCKCIIEFISVHDRVAVALICLNYRLHASAS